jgi:hypothetical protein
MLTYWYRTEAGAVMSTTPGRFGRFVGTLEVPEEEIVDRLLAALESRLVMRRDDDRPQRSA